MKKDCRYYMNVAMKLAARAGGRTSPNPLVGAVVVKNGRIIGQGYHEKAGFAHAEVVALNKAGEQARGATLYITLEPCTHFGRTPPCVDFIIQRGIKEVVIGMIDPNPVNNGKGIQILRRSGIKVKSGFLEDKLRELNRSYIKYITCRRPFVTVKLAQSLDGKIATKTGESKWITSDKSRIFTHRMRQYHDVILVGANTIHRDNPLLNAWFSKVQPIKAVVDSHLSISPGSNIFSGNSNVIIATVASALLQETKNGRLLAKKARILKVKEKDGQVNLKDLMRRLAQLQITSVLVEGGGTLVGSLFDDGLVDRFIFFISPKVIGGKQAVNSVMGKGVSRLASAANLKHVRVRRFGEDILVEGDVR